MRLITCTSSNLNHAERIYTTHESEMLALVHAFKTWKHQIMLSTVLAYTDNVALKHWRTAENLSPLQVRWLAYIGMFDIEIAHITGVTIIAADAISRLACPAIEVTNDWKAN